MTRQYETKHANAFLILLHPLKRRVSRQKQKIKGKESSTLNRQSKQAVATFCSRMSSQPIVKQP
jgi:hypothetical protein